MNTWRKRYVKRHVADLITEALEWAVEDKSLTREEVQETYKRLAEFLDNTDLLPKDREPSLSQLFGSSLKPVWKGDE